MNQNDQTKSRYFNLSNVKQLDSFKMPKNGEHLESDNVILRFKNGFLHADNEPAVECADTHLEYWQNGQLHRVDGPAVISDYGNHLEYWENGKSTNKITEELSV